MSLDPKESAQIRQDLSADKNKQSAANSNSSAYILGKPAIQTLLTLTPEQKAVAQQALLYLKNCIRVVALDGPAGTGKTEVAKDLARQLSNATLAATTNKAARVLTDKLLQAGVNRTVETVHSAVYKPRIKVQAKPIERWICGMESNAPTQQEMLTFVQTFSVETPTAEMRSEAQQLYLTGQRSAAWACIGIRDFRTLIDGWDRKERVGGTIIIDEASMLGAQDLESVLAVYDSVIMIGDAGQLPPVNAEPAFHACPTRVTLKTVHRQTADSPVLMAASQVRSSEKELHEVLEKYPGAIPLPLILAGEAVCIVYRNATRIDANRRIRAAAGRTGGATTGDLIIIRSNDQGFALNQILRVVDATSDSLVVVDPSAPSKRPERIIGWNEDESEVSVRLSGAVPYRFAFCLTCHAAQGSEWEVVFINPYDIPRMVKPNERKQWGYTALTRARSAVYSFI